MVLRVSMHSLSKSENGAMKEVALSNTGHHSLQWMLVIMIMVIPRVGERTAERWLSRIGWSQRGLKGHPSQLHSHYSSFRADTICTNRTSPLCIIFYHPASLCLSAHHQQHHPTVHHQMQNLEGKWGRMMIIIIIDHPVMILP